MLVKKGRYSEVWSFTDCISRKSENYYWSWLDLLIVVLNFLVKPHTKVKHLPIFELVTYIRSHFLHPDHNFYEASNQRKEVNMMPWRSSFLLSPSNTLSGKTFPGFWEIGSGFYLTRAFVPCIDTFHIPTNIAYLKLHGLILTSTTEIYKENVQHYIILSIGNLLLPKDG